MNAWLTLHEAAATQRAYRKEAERLILWAILERGKPLSSLTTEEGDHVPRVPAPPGAMHQVDRPTGPPRLNRPGE